MLPSLDFKWWLLGGSHHNSTGFVGVWDKPLLDTWGHAPCKDVLSNYTGSSPYFGKVGSDTLFCGEKNWTFPLFKSQNIRKISTKYNHSTTKACLKPPSPEFFLGVNLPSASFEHHGWRWLVIRPPKLVVLASILPGPWWIRPGWFLVKSAICKFRKTSKKTAIGDCVLSSPFLCFFLILVLIVLIV